MNTLVGIVVALFAIFLIIKGITDVREETGKLLEAGKNPFQRIIYFIIGFPLLVVAALIGFAHDFSPFFPYVIPTPTLIPLPHLTPHLFPLVTPTP